MPLAIKAALPSSTQTVTGASGTGSVATLSFAGPYTAPLGSTIIVTGVSTAGYNGTYVVTASSSTSVSYANTTTGGASGGSVYSIAPGGSVTLAATNTASDYTLTLPAATGTVALTASPTFSGNVTVGANLTFSGTAARINGDMTNATASNRLTFQTSTTNGATALGIIPNGTSNFSGLVLNNSSDPNNAAQLYLQAYSSYVGIFSDITGTGTYQPMSFNTGGAERMRIDTSGNLLVGTTSQINGQGKFVISVSGNWAQAIQVADTFTQGILTTNTSGTGTYNAMGFYNNGTTFSFCGGITVSGSSTSFNTSSDYRLKENITPLTAGLATIGALKPVNYDWVCDKSRGEGFIAHELAEVIPLAVTGEKDAVNEDGSIKPQGVDYSKIVVHLVAAIQELSAKNDALEARLAALEAK